MNFDLVFYNTLTPLVLAYKGYAASIIAAGFIINWVRGTWLGIKDPEKQKRWWRSSILSILVYVIFYVPVPNPGQMIGFQDDGFDVEQTAYKQTTAGIFIIERLSYGFDALTVSLLSWDVTISSQENLQTKYKHRNGKYVASERKPNKSEVLKNFFILRGQFLMQFGKNYMNTDDLDKKGIISSQEQDSFSEWGVLDQFSPTQWLDYITKQIYALIYQLFAGLVWALAMILLIVCGLVLFLIAGISKYALIYIFALVIFLMPFGLLLNGTKAVQMAVNALLVYLPMKCALAIVIWITFFMIESIVLQGYYDMQSASAVNETMEQLEPGFLFTPSGSTTAGLSENLGMAFGAAESISTTLASVIVCLLCMLYIVFKTPGLISSVLGLQSFTNDLFTSFTMLGTTPYVAGMALYKKMANHANSKNKVETPPSEGTRL